MTIEQITAILDTIAADSYYFVVGANIHLTIDDFQGFDEDWEEIYREYEDSDAIDSALAWLESHADEVSGDFYRYYRFGDVTVHLGYSSFDI